MLIERITVGTLAANCYLYHDGSRGVIIDPGDDYEYIYQRIADLGFSPLAIIATHGHFDHIMAVNELKLAYNIGFYAPEKDEFLIKRMRSSAKYFTGVDPGPPPKIDKFIASTFSVYGIKLEVIETPGHTPGSVCLYDRREQVVFSGDLMFEAGGVGRYDFEYSDRELLYKSISKILKMEKDIRIYPGHSDDFFISEYAYSFDN